jgi:hypothetical protein
MDYRAVHAGIRRLSHRRIAIACAAAIAALAGAANVSAAGTGGCTSGQLKPRPGQLSAATGRVIVAFSIVNRSASTCTLYGYPKVQMLNAHGAPMATHAIKVPPGSGTFFGNAPPEQVVTLTPGRKAWFWLIFAQPTFVNPAGCPTSSALRITPSGTGRGVTLTGSAGRLSTVWQVTTGHFRCSTFEITPLAGAGPRFP